MGYQPFRTWLALAAVLLVVGALATIAAPALAQDICDWQKIGQSTKNLHHVAGAFDTDANHLYIYGGLNNQLEPQNSVEVADLSDPASFSASHKNVSAGGAKKLVGAAGAYRAKGADSDDSAAYFIGGTSDIEDGTGTSFVQRYMTKSGTWETITPGGTFADRWLAAAAYDPVHDVIWVSGGVGSCSITDDVLDGNPCPANTIGTSYLSFDPTAGPTWNTLSGGGLQLYAHTMVYDSAGSRMLVFGGTKNIQGGQSAVMALDLSDPDPSKAQWSTLSTSGQKPTVYFHSAAYDSNKNHMVTYGGVKSDFLQSREATESRTFALDLGTTPNPTWVDLGATMGDRVAGAMAYDPIHQGMVFTLGRDKIRFSGEDPSPSADRTTQGLTCQPAPTPVPTNTTAPTITPGGPATPVPTAPVVPTVAPGACNFINNRVPAAIINAALANPGSVQGYNELQNPGVPESPYNVRRTHLSLRNIAAPWHPLYNGLIYKAGCP